VTGGLEGGGGGGGGSTGVMEGVGSGISVTGGGGVVVAVSLDEIGGRKRNDVDSVGEYEG